MEMPNVVDLVHMVISTFLKFSNITEITSKWSSIRNNKTKKPFPPGPKPWPIIGSLPEMLLHKKPTFHWIHKIMEEMDTEIACIRLGNVHVIPVTSPELACEFLKIQDSVFSSRPICMSTNLVSNGYLTSLFVPIGDQWMKMRRILASHVLSPTSLRWLRHKRDEEADHLLRFVYNQCINKSAIDLRKVTRNYCWNVTRNMIFSKRLFGKEAEEQVDAIFTLLKYVHSFGISDYLPWLSVFDLDGHQAIIKKAYAVATKHLYDEVDQRIQVWKDGNKNVEEDIIDVLIMLKDTNGDPLMTVKEIKAQVLVSITMLNYVITSD